MNFQESKVHAQAARGDLDRLRNELHRETQRQVDLTKLYVKVKREEAAGTKQGHSKVQQNCSEESK